MCDDVRMATVFLVDDHEIVRRGVRELLDSTDDISVIGEAGTVVDALFLIPQNLPDILVLDVRLPDGSGIEVCREIRSEHPEVRCLMLTAFEEDDALLNAVLAGADGFVLKKIQGNELVEAVRAIAGGRSLLDATNLDSARGRLRTRGDNADARLQYLTPQELRILECLADGLTNRQIADKMFLAEKTVKNYVSSLLCKMGVSRRTEAAVFAARKQVREEQRN